MALIECDRGRLDTDDMMTPHDVSSLLEAFPTTPLGHYPTPLEPAPRLGDELGLELAPCAELQLVIAASGGFGG